MTKITCSTTGITYRSRVLTAIMEAKQPLPVDAIARLVELAPASVATAIRSLYRDGRIVRRREGEVWGYWWNERMDQGG